MSAPKDNSDEIKQLQDVEEEWAELRKDELDLVKILQTRAAAEQEKMKQLEAAGDFAGAEKARAKEREYLEEADDLIKQAKEAVRKESDIESQEDRTRHRPE